MKAVTTISHLRKGGISPVSSCPEETTKKTLLCFTMLDSAILRSGFVYTTHLGILCNLLGTVMFRGTK